ncbi:NAD-dependent epimerase/dehydratase family protein [Coraliomargarita parva]|uniref:NAD-dependent epimerase/dehydratase family protein n=1 Tax=Coraliomargarita parva TaxID=3014050 RepID=UPI0022B5691B|nr:NAD(P)-dependent oxidoreductase [Coraliomargarita parva]
MLAKHYPESWKGRPRTDGPRSVLVTGAGGRIGTRFAQAAKDQYALKLMLRPGHSAEQTARLEGCGTIVEARLEDLEALTGLFDGVDTIVHLAAESSPFAEWETLHRDNIIGAYNVVQAARSAGCRRVILASSIHAVSAYPAEEQVKTHEPVCPGDLYGVSKCFAEALGRYTAEVHGLSCIAIRIGMFLSRKTIRSRHPQGGLDFWVSPRDLNQLIQLCIENEDLLFAVFHGISDNQFKHLDISDARELLGYEPQDDAFAETEEDIDWPH